MNSDILIVFAKYPEPGKTKTRLIPALGAVEAADLQHRMSRRTIATAKECSRDTGVKVEIRFTGGTAGQMETLYGADLTYREQREGDLGERLTRAISDAICAGAQRIVVIGTDCPALSADHLRSAFSALVESDVVLGPALDGGYYLVGLREKQPELFDGIDWGTGRVLRQTLDAARRMRSSVRLLETLSDIDRPEDLRHMPPH